MQDSKVISPVNSLMATQLGGRRRLVEEIDVEEIDVEVISDKRSRVGEPAV